MVAGNRPLGRTAGQDKWRFCVGDRDRVLSKIIDDGAGEAEIDELPLLTNDNAEATKASLSSYLGKGAALRSGFPAFRAKDFKEFFGAHQGTDAFNDDFFVEGDGINDAINEEFAAAVRKEVGAADTKKSDVLNK
ncbi:hypothetical protein HDU96_009894 [Phlyctochytrium bullatum]|nr:hypothetical protein HDU96_009894 [Phlyctochytrium bullatum]